MNQTFLLSATALVSLFAGSVTANAQDDVVIVEESITIDQPVECKTHYSSSWRDNWFLQIGAGMQTPFVENALPDGSEKHHITAVYNLGVGHWFSPYLGFRFSGLYGKMRWDFIRKDKAQMASLNADLLWDMTASIGGVNPDRVFSVIPFVGVGGTFTWDFKGDPGDILNRHITDHKKNQWTIPVSAGLQFRLRLCKYADFFAEARAQFYGDNFNNYAQGEPIDVNLTAIAGININFGGRKFNAYNPCDYLEYVNTLNGRVNTLRGELAATSAALAAAAAQLPCPEANPQTVTTDNGAATPMLASVRFKINSAVISNEEMVNVYNVAQYLKENPEVTISINGYADEETGTKAYNQQLSERRAQAVKDALSNDYGIDPSRLSINAFGSSTQPYPENNWNRIVIFTRP